MSVFTREDAELVRQLITAVQEYSGGAYHLEETMAEDLANRLEAVQVKAVQTNQNKLYVTVAVDLDQVGEVGPHEIYLRMVAEFERAALEAVMARVDSVQTNAYTPPSE